MTWKRVICELRFSRIPIVSMAFIVSLLVTNELVLSLVLWEVCQVWGILNPCVCFLHKFWDTVHVIVTMFRFDLCSTSHRCNCLFLPEQPSRFSIPLLVKGASWVLTPRLTLNAVSKRWQIFRNILQIATISGTSGWPCSFCGGRS